MSLTIESTAVTFHLCNDWSLLPGQSVEIRRIGRLVRAGFVDAVMPDGSMLWLAADYEGSRTLFEQAEGYEAWAPPLDLANVCCSRLPADTSRDQLLPHSDIDT